MTIKSRLNKLEQKANPEQPLEFRLVWPIIDDDGVEWVEDEDGQLVLAEEYYKTHERPLQLRWPEDRDL